MQLTQSQRVIRFKEASPAQLYFYSDPQSGVELNKISLKYGISLDQYPLYIQIVGDIILRFYPPHALLQLFKDNLAQDDSLSQALTTDVLNFLHPLINEFESPTVPTPGRSEFQETNTLSNDIFEAEAELAHVVSVRTMARDMEDLQSQGVTGETTHSSSQPALRVPTPAPVPQPAVPQPTPAPSTSPRWGSEEN